MQIYNSIIEMMADRMYKEQGGTPLSSGGCHKRSALCKELPSHFCGSSSTDIKYKYNEYGEISWRI